MLNQFYVVSEAIRSDGRVVIRLYAYDPATNSWTSKKAPPIPEFGDAGPLVKVFVNGQPRLFLATGFGPSYLYTP